jgi:hypothetical protein
MEERLIGWRRLTVGGTVALILCAAHLCSCVATKETVVAPPPAVPATGTVVRTAPHKPELPLPPAPQRSEADVWKEAYRRADALKPTIERDIAMVVPGPLPEIVKPTSPSSQPKA